MVKATKKVTPKAKAATKKSEPKAKFGARRTPASKSWYKQMWPKQWVMVSLALFLLLVLGYIGLNKYQIAQEKKQFDAAASGVDEIYKGIVAAVGQPKSSEQIQTCSYSSAKLYKGFLRCGTRYSFSYSINNTDFGDSLIKKAQVIVANHPNVTNSTVGMDKYPSTGVYKEYGAFNYDGFKEKCITSYELSKDSLEIYIGCSGLAKAEHYPVRD